MEFSKFVNTSKLLQNAKGSKYKEKDFKLDYYLRRKTQGRFQDGS
jgi:hypothetical protein